jgi:creatinine amidohydrolase
MQWEHLTSADFAQAVADTGVALFTMGVIEKHSDHLPLGTDTLNVHKIACLAAEQEPAVVFPPFYFGQIYEARCFPGTITIEPKLLLALLEGMLDEIGRNGFRKIIIVNGHGGNSALIPFLAQTQLWQEKPYSVYVAPRLSADRQEAWAAITDTEYHGHACECETSVSLANHPELVHMERVPDEPALPLGRLSHLPGNMSGASWYANHPEHYAGDARTATAEKGRQLRELLVDTLAEFIAAVKADETVTALQAEFFGREDGLAR